MEVTLTHNSVIAKDVQFGENFSNITGDLIIDKKGRVQIIIDENHSFYTDLHHVPPRILFDISDYMKNREDTRMLKEIKNKIDRVANIKLIAELDS